MQYSNYELKSFLEALKPLLKHRDIIGYAAARNTRKIQSSLEEYSKIEAELVEKYGEELSDSPGRFKISADSKNWEAFKKDLDPYGEIKHDVDIMLLDYETVIGLLSGEEILSLDWMLIEKG